MKQIVLRSHAPLPNWQRGASVGGVMIVLLLVVFFATLAIRLVPSYITFKQVKGVMDKLPEKSEVVQGGPRAIMTALSTQLGIEGIRHVSTQDFKLVKTGAGLELQVAYEAREHIVSNIDVVMSFAHTTLIPTPPR